MKLSLWIVRILMLRPDSEWLAPGEYVATRVVEAPDADEACALAVERERARQSGILDAGGIEHLVMHIEGVTRSDMEDEEVRPRGMGGRS